MKVALANGVYWVGAIDWNLRFCGSYNTPRGTTYNAYLIVDEKIALVDTVKTGFEDEMLKRIGEIVDPAKIDYIICNHAEMDHSGAMLNLMEVAKKAKIYATSTGKDTLWEHYSRDWDVEVVKTGDELSLGKKTLRFISASMLHWPDNMFTYIKEDHILMSNDAFGGHIAAHYRFEDEVGPAAMDEATKYFAVIVSLYSTIVQKKLKEIKDMGIAIDMIAPAHGAIWRSPGKILDAYDRWSRGEAGCKATVVFDTMWHSTEKMAREVTRGIADKGVEARLFNLRTSDWSEIIKEIIESRAIVVGSPTLNMGMYPTVGGFLTFLKGIRPPNKKAAAFGSYGWGKGAVRDINKALKDMKIELLPSLEVKYIPNEDELNSCYEFGKEIAKEVIRGG
ncbi:MAG: FprA family A-type flavoprotein [Candidatus Hydrothermarchaeota archaeon]|nr:FprA family A-type flavoprotein [Candidatus Hydrothermarchaeota archaeon]